MLAETLCCSPYLMLVTSTAENNTFAFQSWKGTGAAEVAMHWVLKFFKSLFGNQVERIFKK